jgi:hypothetical protein
MWGREGMAARVGQGGIVTSPGREEINGATQEQDVMGLAQYSAGGRS